MKRKILTMFLIAGLTVSLLTGCGQAENADKTEGAVQQEVTEQVEAIPEATDEITDTHNNNEYYLNSQGILVDKVEEFKTETFGEYVLEYPILGEGVDEVVVYEFDTNDNVHVIIDASNVYQQTGLDEMGDYGDVQLETVAQGKDVVYMFDGERYYIEDYTINLLTISQPISDN